MLILVFFGAIHDFSFLALSQIAILISLGFIGCWTPYGLVSLWSIFNDSSKIPPEVSLLPCMFAKSSTVYNPMIYYFFSKSFKREVKQLPWLCVGANPCHVSNSVNDNNIYMVSVNVKSKETRRETLQEITESRQWHASTPREFIFEELADGMWNVWRFLVEQTLIVVSREGQESTPLLRWMSSLQKQ